VNPASRTSPPQLKTLLASYPAEQNVMLAGQPVVGNIKKNDPSLIEAVAANQPACVARSGICSQQTRRRVYGSATVFLQPELLDAAASARDAPAEIAALGGSLIKCRGLRTTPKDMSTRRQRGR
jgi:hypothetical protein